MPRRHFVVPDSNACAAVNVLLAMGAGAVVLGLAGAAGIALPVKITLVGVTAFGVFLALGLLSARRSNKRRQHST